MAPLRPQRITYLDGLRGIAAMQVVLQHFVRAFAPGWFAPLGFLADGDFAVYVFFLLSGFVLTPSFARTPGDVGGNLLRRVVRLAVPALVAVAIGAVAFAVFGDTARAAARLSGSGWFQGFVRPRGFAAVLADLDGLSLLAGYASTGLIDATWLPRLSSATIPPLWTLHIELWGSVWIILLAWARGRGRWWHGGLLVGSVWLVGSNELLLFSIGHGAALLTGRPQWAMLVGRRGAGRLGLGLIVAGVALDWALPWLGVAPGWSLLPAGPLRRFDWLSWLSAGAAVAVFAGVLLARPAQAVLGAGLPHWLGRLSFPIYLLHWPVMIALGASLYVGLAPGAPAVAAGVAIGAGIAASLAAAWGFERWCDQPVIRAARALGSPRR